MSARDAVTILVVDDEEAVLNGVRRTLRAEGFENVLMCRDPRDVEPLLDAERVSLILLDLMMPHISGRELLERIAAAHPEIPVIIVTAEQDIRTAVDCMKTGAYDYLLKPAAPPELMAVIMRALEHRELREENARLRSKLLQEELARPEQFDEIITVDAAMHGLFAYLEVIATGSNPVLITGETGTGKELFARAIHNLSDRRGPFCAVNVAGLDDTMFSDTLFGHKPGAFTGAIGTRKGMIEAAGRGTLFLDEIGDLSEASQVKLLRVLQEREYHTLGDDAPKRLEARVVAATHHDPAKLRRDLYFRLRAYHVRIPPLRERTGDLPSLVNHFVREASHDLDRKPPVVPDRLYRVLSRYAFPGNVRELRALVFDAVARHSGGPLPVDPFLESIGGSDVVENESSEDIVRDSVIPEASWRELERRNLLNALKQTNWKISGKGGAAELLEIKPSTLESRMKSFAIEKP
ncbi:MAG TPA: sigma-54 dependent transcriptional regulator [Thermoanaerobaculia bacterium]|jgi:DNA-binding NtrC family response regulator|nr:sigma-54 dependent transcriptional regulator [Thermoanaerobaculia bacterium]